MGLVQLNGSGKINKYEAVYSWAFETNGCSIAIDADDSDTFQEWPSVRDLPADKVSYLGPSEPQPRRSVISGGFALHSEIAQGRT